MAAPRCRKDQVWTDRAVRTADNKAETPPEVPPEKRVQAVVDGAAELKKKWGRLDGNYGEIYRVGREGTSGPGR